jgi:hypothetical protein
MADMREPGSRSCWYILTRYCGKVAEELRLRAGFEPEQPPEAPSHSNFQRLSDGNLKRLRHVEANIELG